MNKLDNINLDEIKTKLYENLKPSGWGDKLKTFILSDDFNSILNKLLEEAKDGKRFTPVLKQVFRAFEECPVNNLKVVIMGQDSYPQPYVADGIAFSCSNIGKPEVSLRYLFKAIDETVYPEGHLWDPDLARWSNQGILLTNCALTTTIHKVGSHYDLWKPFMSFLFDYITHNHPGLIYVFMGRKAQEWSDVIPDNSSYKIFTSHPASAAYKDLPSWDCNDMFQTVSELVEKQFNEKIIW